jgi:hypothetical protein
MVALTCGVVIGGLPAPSAGAAPGAAVPAVVAPGDPQGQAVRFAGTWGQLIVPPPDEEGSQAWIFRGAEATLTRFGEG